MFDFLNELMNYDTKREALAQCSDLTINILINILVNPHR